MTVCIPYDKGGEVSALHSSQKVLNEEYTPDGTRMELLVDSAAYERLKQYLLIE